MVKRNVRRRFGSITCRIPIRMLAGTQSSHCNVWSLLATTLVCSLKPGDRSCENEEGNRNASAICNTTYGIHGGRGASHHPVATDSSDGPRPLRPSPKGWIEISFADVRHAYLLVIMCNTSPLPLGFTVIVRWNSI